MRYSLLIFGLVSASSAVVFEAIDFPLGAMIGPIFAVGILAYLTRESSEPGVDATDFAIMLIGIVLGSQVTPEVLNHAKKMAGEHVFTVADDGSNSLYPGAS